MIAFFVGIVRARDPIGGERMLHAAGRMQRVWSFVARIDQRCRRIRPSIHGLQRGGPAVLCEIVVEKSEACADYRAPARPWRIRHSQARAELFAIILRS